MQDKDSPYNDQIAVAFVSADACAMLRSGNLSVAMFASHVRDETFSEPMYLSHPCEDLKPITLDVLRDYFKAMDAGDVPDPALALYSYLLMDGFIDKKIAKAEVRAALYPPQQSSEQVNG